MKTSSLRFWFGSLVGLLGFTLRLLAAEPTPAPPPTQENIPYGPHARNVLDFWKADQPGPRPLLVYIHGGGWRTGDKREKGPAISPWLARGVSFAALNYRLTPEHPLPAPVHDAARAIQFLRSRAADWNINPARIALTGPSAGACTSMWLLLHDDLADPKAADPILRQSTRVCAAAVAVGQTSIDPMVIDAWVRPNILKHVMIPYAVGEPTIEAALRNYERHRSLYIEFSPINHLDAQDSPLFMTYSAERELPSRNAGHGIHHPVLGMKLKQKSDALGHECHLIVPGFSKSEAYADGDAFLRAKLLAE